MALTINTIDKTSPKSSSGRSGISSPYFDLAASIAVAETIYKTGGGACSPEQLAPWLGYKSIGSGTYLTRVSAANKHFGLVEISDDRIIITERARKILSPVLPEDAVNAKIDAFLGVPLFSRVFEQFRGNSLPPEVGLKNLFLNTYKILPDRVSQAVRVFLNSAEQAGFFSTTGDRSRLVKPNVKTSPDAPPSTAQNEQPSAPEKQKSGGGSSGDGPPGVHSAIVGLLRELPAPGTPWSGQKKQRFLDAFKATVDFIYPEENAP